MTHPLHPQPPLAAWPAAGRDLDPVAARKECPGDAPRICRHVVGRPCRHHLAAALPRPGAKVDHPVGGADRLLVVFDNDDGVPLVAEGFERPEQAGVVARMKADGGLVEDVEHPREPRADLGGEADPLALATGERRCLAVEGQVAEADLIEEIEPRANLLEQLRSDHALRRVERERGEKLPRVGDREAAEAIERQLWPVRRTGRLRGGGDPDGPRLRREPGPLAPVAGGDPHQLLEHPPEDPALGIPPPVAEHREDPLEPGLRPPFGLATLPGQPNLFEARALEPDPPLQRREILPRGVEEGAGGELALRFGVRGDPREQAPHPARHVAEAPQDPQRSFAERLARLGDELVGVDAVDLAEPLAGRAGPLRAVEAEQLRFGRGVAHPTGGAGVAAREDELVGARLSRSIGRFVVVIAGLSLRLLLPCRSGCRCLGGRRLPLGLGGHDHHSPAGAEREFDRLGEPAAGRFARNEPIDHHLDRVLEELLERRRILDADDAAIDAGPGESLTDEIGEQVAVFPLGVAHQGREHEDSPPAPLGEDPLDDRIAGLGLEDPVTLGAVGATDPRVEHAEEIVDLGHRRHRRTGVCPGRLLRDGDRGREAGDAVDVRPRQLAEELAGKGGEALDVPALTLGVERVERQARLPRPAHSGEADQPAAGDPDSDVAEVVLAGTADHDRGNLHGKRPGGWRGKRQAGRHCSAPGPAGWTSPPGCHTIGFPGGRLRRAARLRRGGSSTGRARRSQCRGWEFDPPPLH